MFNLSPKKKQEREPFDLFLMHEILQNPDLNLDALDMYIKKYSLEIRYSLDEPKILTEKRTKLKILEECSFSDPKNCDYPQLHQYINCLRIFVEGFKSFTPEMLKALKEREKKD